MLQRRLRMQSPDDFFRVIVIDVATQLFNADLWLRFSLFRGLVYFCSDLGVDFLKNIKF